MNEYDIDESALREIAILKYLKRQQQHPNILMYIKLMYIKVITNGIW